MQQWTRRVLWVERWSSALAGLAFALFLSVLGNWLTSTEWFYPLLVLTLAMILGLASWWLRRQRPRGPLVRFEPPIALRTAIDCELHARRGFIGFVSLYRPQDGSPLAGLTPESWRAAATRGDLDALDLPHSNLWPTISAILCHRSCLEHCWLLATPQSRPYTAAMIAYLRREGLICNFYGDQDRYTIPTQVDESLLFHRAYEAVRTVQHEAAALKLGSGDIVADFTAGVRSMTIGMILACLGEDQDVEVVGSQFTDDNRPTGALLPLIFRFRPELDAEA